MWSAGIISFKMTLQLALIGGKNQVIGHFFPGKDDFQGSKKLWLRSVCIDMICEGSQYFSALKDFLQQYYLKFISGWDYSLVWESV